MPHTRSARKRLRQDEKRRRRNMATKRRIKNRIKEFHSLLSEGNIEEATRAFREIQKLLDRAGSKCIIHPNKADRVKAKLARELAGVSPVQQTAPESSQ